MSKTRISVIVWNEFEHERENAAVRAIYPDGLHAVIADALRDTPALNPGALPLEVSTATLDEPEHGLGEDRLAGCDVLIWWGHKAHGKVADAIVERVQRRVLEGMGLIVLHSGHFSKIFRRLMGTNCSLKWREADEKERVWVVEPSHPIAAGLGEYFELPYEEMYGERFDIPHPDEHGVHLVVRRRRGVPLGLHLGARPRPHLLLPPRPRGLPDLLRRATCSG